MVGLIAAALLSQGCGVALKSPPETEALPIKRVKGYGTSKALLKISGTQVQYYKGKEDLPPFSKGVQIDAMAFRSLLDDPSDQTPEARKDDKLVDQCPPGRPTLDFIQKIDVGVRHSNQKDTEAVVVATYRQAQKGLCGIHLTPTYFDMKEYASDYVFVIQVTGTLPEKPVAISGYYTAQDYEGF